jgi:hypothetical protein
MLLAAKHYFFHRLKEFSVLLKIRVSAVRFPGDY